MSIFNLCFVVMQAMSRVLPVICVDVGGLKVHTTDELAIKIKPAPMGEIIYKVTEANVILVNNSDRRFEMEKNCTHALKCFLISERTKQMNRYYKEVINK